MVEVASEILSVSLEEEMQQSYLDYAMSVIRQGSPDDDAHRVVEIGLLHLLFEAYRQNLTCNFNHTYSTSRGGSVQRAES